MRIVCAAHSCMLLPLAVVLVEGDRHGHADGVRRGGRRQVVEAEAFPHLSNESIREITKTRLASDKASSSHAVIQSGEASMVAVRLSQLPLAATPTPAAARRFHAEVGNGGAVAASASSASQLASAWSALLVRATRSKSKRTFLLQRADSCHLLQLTPQQLQRRQRRHKSRSARSQIKYKRKSVVVE